VTGAGAGVGVGVGVGGGDEVQAVPLYVNPAEQFAQVDEVPLAQVTLAQFATAVQFVHVPLLLYW
jgi:hypothetical protein